MTTHPTCNNTGFMLAGNAHDHVMKAMRFYAMARSMREVVDFQKRDIRPGEEVRMKMYLRDGDEEQAKAEAIDDRAIIYRRKDYPIATGVDIVAASADHSTKKEIAP